MTPDFNSSGSKFTGIHSTQVIKNNPDNFKITLDADNIKLRDADKPYQALVEAKNSNGDWITKSGRDGVSSFFPDSWDKARILEEVEHAVKNNRGALNSEVSNQYFGYSKDGSIKISFYYNESSDSISSYFPVIN